MFDFKDKTVLITGGAVGIGRACAIRFAELGANVAIVDINPETLKETENELLKIGENIIAIPCDVSYNEAVTDTVNKVYDRFGKVDILVNNAALWRHASPFVDTDIEVWKKFIDVNILGTVYFTKAVIGKMIEQSYGRIINVASVAGVYGNADMTHYSATKGAVISFTKALAKEVSGKGITVNSVSPGSVSPAQNRDINFFQESELSFTGRTGTAAENADIIVFLASDRAGYISGQNIQIDGCRKKQ